MSKNLVIVESPAKAKTIEKYLGKDFTVKSSFGHVRDLPKKNMNIDIEGGTFQPTYEVSPDKTKVINELKREAKGKEVWLAADHDREGEAIAWHVCQALNLDTQKTKRITFSEITKPGIMSAMKKPGTINQPLVDAQQARRVLDRLVGYELSPVLWKKIKAGLSAGRVQSVAVRVIVERERAIRDFEASSNFKVTAEFDLGEIPDQVRDAGKIKPAILKAECSQKFEDYDSAKTFVEALVGADFKVDSIVSKPSKKSPSAPFTTSTLQQEASRKLSFSVKQTMMVAQRLYEAGKITYMRTDSVNLSDQAVGQAAQMIEKEHGKKYVSTRKFKTKSASAQEAHEAIRPTDLTEVSVAGERNEQRLYDLIWKRTVASQMADAKLEKTTATIAISTREETFQAQGEVLQFDGFLKIYLESKDDEDDEDTSGVLPPIKEGQILDMKQTVAKETFARPKPRFTEASLVKALEEMGIGRPSTYAPTISTIQDRGYIERKDKPAEQRQARLITLTDKIEETSIAENYGAEKSKLFPTDIGKVVNDFLVKHFSDIVDFKFTAKVEEEFDAIAEGKKKWNAMIKKFYGGFHETVEAAGGISREEASSQRELGKDPKTKKPVIARVGRFGPMVQIGVAEDEEKPAFASIPEGVSVEEVTLEQALKMFEFPRNLGQIDGEDILVNTGRFGPYVKCGKTNASLKKETVDEAGNKVPGDDPHSVDLNRATELILEKRELDKNKYIAEWPEKEIQLLRGPYGIYIKHGKKNVRIPKDVENPEKLKLEEIEKIIEAAQKSKGRRFTKKK